MFLPRRLLAYELTRNGCWRNFLHYQKALLKTETNRLRTKFLENCKRSDLIPKFLKFRVPNNGCFDDKAVHEFQKRLLNKEIMKAKDSQQSLLKTLTDRRSALKQKLPHKCLPSILFHTRRTQREHRGKQTAIHNKKLSNLSEEQDRPLFSVENTVMLYELETVPPKFVLETLSLGPKNAVLNPFDPKDILAELDLFIDYCEEKFICAETISDINIKTLQYIKNCKRIKCTRNINMTRKYLKENNLLAIPFDKGIGICVMKSETYYKKMDDIIKLPQFEKVEKKRKNEKHPILKEEERIQRDLKEMLDSNEISKTLYDKLRPRGSQPPRLYGLAKVHKEEVPVRPVLSMPGSAYYGIGKQLALWLSNIPECRINSSTKSVRDSLKEMRIEDGREIVSFDVSSLYTNVPVSEAIQICADLMFNGSNPVPPVSKDTFIKLLQMSSCDVILSTHDGFYRQIDGLAMGSPPAPHLANAWMSQFDDTIKGSSDLYSRYMDDIICDKETDEIDNKLESNNNLHENLNFTMERGKSGKLVHLDMLVMRENNSLSSTWYTKPSDTGLVMNFHALAPKKYKRSVVSGMVHRIVRACSCDDHVQNSLAKAKMILMKNQYPSKFIDKIFQETLDKIKETEQATIDPSVMEITDTNDESTDTSSEHSEEDLLEPTDSHGNNIDKKELFRFFVQYRGKCTDHFSRALHKLGAPCIVVKTLRKLKTVMPSLKPPVSKEFKSCVVYKITCPSCQACYVGQTSRHLITRISEHKNKSGPVKHHFLSCCSKPVMENVDILASSIKSEKHLLVYEALFIRDIVPFLNTKDEYKQRTLKIKFG